jgi:hypothetical protein
MTAIRSVTLFITILLMSINAFGDDISPGAILKQVADTYKTMETYKVEGTINNETEARGTKSGSKFSFSILLKKPNLYLITWKQTNAPPDRNISIAAWHDETQPYMYFGMSNSYAKIKSDEMALHIVMVMKGPSLNLPSLFLPSIKGHEKPFSWLKNPKIEKVEKIGEENCYVISGTSSYYKREVLWVSKTGYLIRKYYHSEEPPEGGSRWPGMTDEDIIRQKENEEARKHIKRTGFHSEVYAEISSPEVNRDNFDFALPESAVRNDDRYTN